MNNLSIAAIGGGIAIVVIAIAVAAFVFTGMPDDQKSMDGLVDDTNENNVTLQNEEKTRVFASFYPYYEFTRNVAGDAAIVEQYLPSGIEAHDWEPRAQEIQSLKNSDVFVYNGLGMEPYVDNMIDSGEFNNVLFVSASDGIELVKFDEDHDEYGHAEEFVEKIEEAIEEFEHGHFTQSQTIESIEQSLREHESDGHKHGSNIIEDIEILLQEIKEGHIKGPEGIEEIHHLVSGEDVHDEEHKDTHDEELELDHVYDPHIWLDPILAKSQVMTIASHLAQSDPEHAEIYHDNAISYANKLDTLDQEIRMELSSCKKDTFVPFHNAFSYFAERYNLHTIAVIQEFSPETPVTAKDIEELIHFAEDNDIKYFFTEENRNPKLAERLASELGGDIFLFSPLESLSENDALDTTYFDKMRENMVNLKIALECS